VPYTEKQRRLFHELEENPDARKRHGVNEDEARELAGEADDFARRGKERRPVRKVTSFIDLSRIWIP
jgi:hypothetical protein